MSISSLAANTPGTVHLPTSQNATPLDGRGARRAWRLLIWGLGLLPALNAVLNPRAFGLTDTTEVFAGSNAGLLIPALTAMLGGLLVLSSAIRLRLRRSTATLWVAAMLFSSGPLLSSQFGRVGGFSLDLAAIPIVLTAVYLMPTVDPRWFLSEIRHVLLVYVYGSLAAAAIAPAWAIEQPYTQGMIEFLPLRLHGIGTHANNLAPYALAFLVLDFCLCRRGSASALHRIAAVMVLAMAQSKTVWIIGALCLLLLIVSRLHGKRGTLPLLALVFSTAAGIALVVLVASGALEAAPSPSGSGDSVSSLTGRTLIWAFTLAEWQANPIFGYGPALWGAEMRSSYLGALGWSVPHAHNQLFQTLGESGILGFVGLVIYLLILSAIAWRCRHSTKGASVALLVVLLVRGLTEPVLRAVSRDGNFFLHFALYSVLMLVMARTATNGNATSPLRGVS